MAGQRSPKTRPTTLSQQGSTVLSRSRNIIYYVITVVENNKDNENHGSRRIKHLFLVSRKIILQNHASRLLWKSRFTRKKLAISHFTGKKRADHESRKYRKIPFTTLYLTLVTQSITSETQTSDRNVSTLHNTSNTRSLRHFGPLLWSKVNRELRSAPTLSNFKKASERQTLPR